MDYPIFIYKEEWWLDSDWYDEEHSINKEFYIKFWKWIDNDPYGSRASVTTPNYCPAENQFKDIFNCAPQEEVILEFVAPNRRGYEDRLFTPRLYRVLTKDGKILFEYDLVNAIVNNTIKFVLPKEKVKT